MDFRFLSYPNSSDHQSHSTATSSFSLFLLERESKFWSPNQSIKNLYWLFNCEYSQQNQIEWKQFRTVSQPALCKKATSVWLNSSRKIQMLKNWTNSLMKVGWTDTRCSESWKSQFKVQHSKPWNFGESN